MTFSELRQKDIINIRDGRKLGRPTDVVFGEHACIEAILIPAPVGFLGMFKTDKECLSVNWSNVIRIGDDVILVDFET